MAPEPNSVISVVCHSLFCPLGSFTSSVTLYKEENTKKEVIMLLDDRDGVLQVLSRTLSLRKMMLSVETIVRGAFLKIEAD